MGLSLNVQLEFLLRIAIAALCGAAIGYERENRMKTAGIRTHLIVSLASALMMVISKYGFYDVLEIQSVGLDPSRIAAGIVTAIGFLGAGVIFVRKLNVSGLTTAAGIWATVGVGMAVGSGLYLIGIACTGMLLLVQFVLHRSLRLVKPSITEQILLKTTRSAAASPDFLYWFASHNIEIVGAKAKSVGTQEIELKLSVRLPETYGLQEVLKLLNEDEEIISIEM